MKQNLVSEEKVLQELKKSIAQSLRIDEDSIKPESSLVEDLGAESLDFLDINYRLEQAFGIRMARHFVIEHVEEMFGEGSAIGDSGQLTERGAELLRIRLGDRAELINAGLDLEQVTALVTVQTMARGIADILDTLPETCTGCGKNSWRGDGARIRCGSCGKDAAFKNGDELIREWLMRVEGERKIFSS
jgi:acyl carrier protein